MFPIVLLCFTIFFPLLWCGVVFLISRIGDWSRLAKHFSAPDRKPSGTLHKGVLGSVGISQYKYTLIVHLNDEGFFLENMWLFRIGHPRLFIPWSAVSKREKKQVLMFHFNILTIGEPKIGKVALALELPER